VLAVDAARPESPDALKSLSLKLYCDLILNFLGLAAHMAGESAKADDRDRQQH
jgi:hypothetical protein